MTSSECGCGWRPRLLWVLTLLVGCVFVAAGVAKAWNPAAFADDLRNYRLFPWPLVVASALYLPWLEIVAGTCILVRRLERPALWIALALCLAFLFSLGQAAIRGLDITCGCFGKAAASTLAEALFRAAALTLATAKLLWHRPYPP